MMDKRKISFAPPQPLNVLTSAGNFPHEVSTEEMSCCEEGRATVGKASAVTGSSLPEDENRKWLIKKCDPLYTQLHSERKQRKGETLTLVTARP